MSFSRELFENWFVLQRKMISGLQRARVHLQGPAVPHGALILRYPAGPDAADDELAQAARLAEQSQAPVTSAQQTDSKTSRIRLAFPLAPGEQISGSIVVEASASLARQAALNQLLQWGATWLDALLNASEGMKPEDGCSDLASAVEAYPDYPSLLTAILATLRQLSGADRVACGIERSGRITLEGVSETVDLDRRSPHARAIIAAMQEAHPRPTPLAWSAETTFENGLAAHAALAQTGHSEYIVTSRHAGYRAADFLFTFEFSHSGPGNAYREGRCRTLGSLSAMPLAFRHQQQGSWLRRLGRLFSEGLSELFSPLRPWQGPAYLVFAVILVVFLFTPTDYRVTARALVEPASQQTIAVPFESFISESAARAGEEVATGDLLIRLDDRELKTRQRGLLAEATELRKKHRQAMATGKLSEARVLEARFEQTGARLHLVEEQLRQTEIRSPINGIVISGDWQRNIGAPVARGDTLFELAPLNNYRTVLLVEDRDIAQIAPSQGGELILAALPSHPLELRVSDIVSIAETEELAALFRVEAILPEAPSSLRPGMEGIAKIVAGQRPRWWVWSHDLIDWLRLQWWRWLP